MERMADEEIYNEELIEGILFKHIQNNPIVGAVMTKVVHESLTEEEGLRLMVNMLADENARLKSINIELTNRVPIRDLAEMTAEGLL